MPDNSVGESCLARYSKMSDLVASAAYANTLCSTNCLCKYNADQTVGFAISNAGGLDLNSGVTTANACSNWRSDFDYTVPLLAALETNYNCRGFCADPTFNIKYFSEINDMPGPYQCHGYYDTYVSSSALSLSLQFLVGALFQALTLVYLPCLETPAKRPAMKHHVLEELPGDYKKGHFA